MTTMMMNENMRMSIHLSEDVNAPELRSPSRNAMGKPGWLARLLGRRARG